MKRMKNSPLAQLALPAVMLCALLAAGCSVIPTYTGEPVAGGAPVTSPGVETASPAVAPVSPIYIPPATVDPLPILPLQGGEAGTIDTIRIGDRLIVTFSDLSTPMPPFEVTVREDGMITLPYNRKALAAGKKRGQLEQEIHVLFVPSIFKQMTPSIRTEDRIITVGGEVRAPNRQVYIGTMTVLKAITSAGGFTEFANKRKVEVIRANKQKDTVDAVKAQEDPRLDLPVYPGDQIHVRRRLF